MNAIVFDTGTIITISLNNLLGKIALLKKEFDGEFLISKEVKYELVDKPLQGKKYKLEALQIQRLINDGLLKVYEEEIEYERILELTNKIYKARDYIYILDRGEIESLLLAVKLNSTYAVDERTMRMLVEDPNGLKELLEKKLHQKVIIDYQKLKEFKKIIQNIKIIRSTELMLVAFEKGFFNNLGDKKEILDALLWSLKLRGCAISIKEIEDIEKMYF